MTRNGSDEPLFELVTSTNIGMTEARPTGECLFGKRWVERPHEFGRWLLPVQRATEPGLIAVLKTLRTASYQEWAAAILQVAWNTPEVELERLLIEKRLVLTLRQAEVLVRRTDNWVTTALLWGTPGNHFFTENNAQGISVVNVRSSKRHWVPHLKGFSSPYKRRMGCHLIIANLTEEKLSEIALPPSQKL